MEIDNKNINKVLKTFKSELILLWKYQDKGSQYYSKYTSTYRIVSTKQEMLNILLGEKEIDRLIDVLFEKYKKNIK